MLLASALRPQASSFMMPDFSFRLPRFLRSQGSRRSQSTASAGTRADGATSHTPYLGPSPAVSSRPPSAHDAPEQAARTATGTSYPLAPSNAIHPQDITGRGCDDRPAIGPSSKVPQIITPIDASCAPLPSPQDSILQPLVHVPHLSASTQCQHQLYSLPTPSQSSSVVEQQRTPPGKDLPSPQHPHQGMFHQAHNLSATGNFIDGNVGSVTNNFSNLNNFMKDLLKETIPGASADSSARDPPPRCHPGTRLAILERCLNFIVHCNGVKKMRWVVGAAGVGKSAVMQNVAESPLLEVASNASVFLSINGRNDGKKAIMTLSYQFAAKSDLYRRVVEVQVSRDPSLFQSSMSIQFEKFVVQPFIHNSDLNTAGRVLIIIDGLDECNDTRTQIELLRLISNFCISHSSSPIVWLIASRPESHITSFFSRPEVLPAYEKEEIAVDSDEARADVERYLRHELTEIGKASDFLGPQWPDEQDLWKLANAAGGLFAYAQTVIRYIGDTDACDPVSQLSDVLNVIDKLPMADIPQEQHPMALLDALYSRILSKVPPKIMTSARKLLLLLASDWHSVLISAESNFIVMCNWLGMTADQAYAALNRLRSVLNFPQRHEACQKQPEPFHKSLIDYLFRSGFSTDIELEAQGVKAQCAFRVLNEAPDGIDCGEVDYKFDYGKLARHGGTGDKISITWRVDEGIDWDDDRTRLSMYKLAIGEVAAGMKRGDPVFQSNFCIKLLTTQFYDYWNTFPCCELSDFVFDKYRCQEFIRHGMLKQMSAKSIGNCQISTYLDYKLQFHRPVTTAALPDPWNSSCQHERVGQWEQGKEQSWTTVVRGGCTSCYQRLRRQLESWIVLHPDQVVSIMFASVEESCVELRFVDLEDDLSEWTYWVWFWNSKELKELRDTL